MFVIPKPYNRGYVWYFAIARLPKFQTQSYSTDSYFVSKAYCQPSNNILLEMSFFFNPAVTSFLAMKDYVVSNGSNIVGSNGSNIVLLHTGHYPRDR